MEASGFIRCFGVFLLVRLEDIPAVYLIFFGAFLRAACRKGSTRHGSLVPLSADGGSQLGRTYFPVGNALLVDGAVALAVLLDHLGVFVWILFFQRWCMLACCSLR